MDKQRRGLVKWVNRFHQSHLAGNTSKALVALTRLESATPDWTTTVSSMSGCSPC